MQEENKPQSIEYWDKVSGLWGEMAFNKKQDYLKFPTSQIRLDLTIAEIVKEYGPKAQILDIGCATGDLVLALIRRGYVNVIGIDNSPKMIMEAKERVKKEFPHLNSDRIFFVSDADSLQLNQEFDIITALGLIEYVKDPIEFLQSVNKLLKNNGIAYIESRNKLFNLYSANQFTIKKQNQEDHIEEIDKIKEFSPINKEEEVQQVVLETFQSLGQHLERVNLKPQQQKPKYENYPFSLPQYTPLEFKELSKQGGFTLKYIIYYHCHPFAPRYEEMFPQLFNRLGALMQKIGYTPMGSLISSSFVAVITKNSNINTKKVLAIIPARGGSKGIPRKNIREVAGKPLIAHSIEQALVSTKITKVVVTTDDEEIAEVARNYGAEVIIRPAELAQDNTPMLPVLKHAVETVRKEGFNPDVVILLQPTSPLRKTIYIDNAIERLITDDVDSVTSVSKISFNPSCLVKATSTDTTVPISTENFIAQRQDVKETYNINGLIYAYKTEALLKLEKGSWCDKNGFIVTPEEDSLDIDEEYHLQIADYLLKRKNTKSQRIKIADKHISHQDPVLIIAEAGSNYNGSLDIAKKLVDVAKEAGADIVKFQTFKADLLVTRTTSKAAYQKEGENDKETYYDMLKWLEMKDEQWQELKDYCDKKGIIFMSTPHSGEWSVDFLESLNVPAYKLGSGDLTNIPFLEYVAQKNKPLIISVGMAIMEEIKEAVEAIKKTGNEEIIVLQCTTSYPADIKNINLNVMDALATELRCIVGFSDHTPGMEASIAAVAKGAKVIEKHFTIDQNLPGPDHKASLNPSELKEMIEGIRRVELMLGNNQKKPTAKELEIAKIARKSIIASQEIPKNSIITKEMLIIKRPGTGILPKYLPQIIGKKAKVDIEKDAILSPEMIE